MKEVAMSIEELAAQIEAALAAEDLDRVAPLLADDVRWGDSDEDFESTCHTRADVLAWYRRMLAGGVKARHIETLVQPHAVIMGWDITWPPGEEERPPIRYQVFRVASGRVADIRGFADKEQALAFSAGR
jgi:SnoaL-like domain